MQQPTQTVSVESRAATVNDGGGAQLSHLLELAISRAEFKLELGGVVEAMPLQTGNNEQVIDGGQIQSVAACRGGGTPICLVLLALQVVAVGVS